MAIARISDCEAWHREYCELYWKHNELQLIGTCAAASEAAKVASRMNELVRLLGYTPAA
jgi:hypothetical protein